MTLSWGQIADVAIETLSPDERATALVYLDQRILPDGERLDIEGMQEGISGPGVVAFVDLEPEVNWGHRCRYLLIDPETGTLRAAVEAKMPPFLRGSSETLRLAWVGEKAPSWAAVTKRRVAEDPTAT